MAVFEGIELSWKGVPYELNGDDQIMRVIADVEDHVRLADLIDGKTPPMAKIAGAFACALRHAGCRVTWAEVYSGLFSDQDSQAVAADAVTALLSMMIPPEHMREKKSPARKTKKKRSKKASSKRPTKRR